MIICNILIELLCVVLTSKLKGQVVIRISIFDFLKSIIGERKISLLLLKVVNVKISGIDKQKVGMIASEIKSFRPPEPYKGKRIKEKGQYILRKEGKKK